VTTSNDSLDGVRENSLLVHAGKDIAVSKINSHDILFCSAVPELPRQVSDSRRWMAQVCQVPAAKSTLQHRASSDSPRPSDDAIGIDAASHKIVFGTNASRFRCANARRLASMDNEINNT